MREREREGGGDRQRFSAKVLERPCVWMRKVEKTAMNEYNWFIKMSFAAHVRVPNHRFPPPISSAREGREI